MGLSACSNSSGAAAAGGTKSGRLKVAYFAFAVQNSYEAPMIAAVKKEASAQDADVTVFDAASNAQKQYGQIQDALASGKYDGFLVDSVDGAGLVPLIQRAVAQKIKVVALNTVLGPDLKQGDPQVEGVSASVVYTAYDRGQHEAKLALQACADVKGTCQIGYMFDFKASGFDQGVRSGFDSVISTNSLIKVVAEGEDKFAAAAGLASAQTMLQAHPDLDVMVGSDQGMAGATQALQAAGKANQVKVIGLGGSVSGLGWVKDGTRFGEVLSMPATQGKLAADALVKALRKGIDAGGINPAAGLPDDGLATAANVDKFHGEWNG
jgi:ribose transport system substrate-binding protein